MNQCTSVSAKWCPFHGDCTCPIDEELGYQPHLDHPTCPLHGYHSTHGEPQGIETAWGFVPFDLDAEDAGELAQGA